MYNLCSACFSCVQYPIPFWATHMSVTFIGDTMVNHLRNYYRISHFIFPQASDTVQLDYILFSFLFEIRSC